MTQCRSYLVLILVLQGLPELPGLEVRRSHIPNQPLGDITAHPPVQHVTLDHFLKKLLHWNPVWFDEQG